MKTTMTFALLAAALTLSACGGGGGAKLAATPQQKAQAHLDEIAEADLFADETAVMPTDGSAVYTGTFGIGAASEPGTFAVGDATLEAHFDVGEMNGSAGNFLYGGMDEEGNVVIANPMEGSLDLEGSFAGATGLLAVTGDLDGTEVSGAMLTGFKGADAGTLLGLGSGTIGDTDLDFYMTVEK